MWSRWAVKLDQVNNFIFSFKFKMTTYVSFEMQVIAEIFQQKYQDSLKPDKVLLHKSPCFSTVPVFVFNYSVYYGVEWKNTVCVFKACLYDACSFLVA